MEKLTLQFDLPDEEHAAKCALHATIAFGALHEIAGLLRNKEKYGESQMVDISDLRGEVVDILNGAGLDAWGLPWWGE